MIWNGLPKNWPTSAVNYLCPYCHCDNFHDESKSHAPYNDFRTCAKWRSLGKQPPDCEPQLNHLQQIDSCFPIITLSSLTPLKRVRKDHPLFTVPGVNPWSVKLDLLHTIDLGTAAHFYGNAVNDIISEHLPGNFQSSFAALNKLIADLYQELEFGASCRIPKLAKSNILGPYPCLRHIKGRRIRHFTDVCLRLCTLYARRNFKGQRRLKACKALKLVYDMADLSEMCWSRNQFKKLDGAIKDFLAHYGWLAKKAYNENKFQYSIVQKTHLMGHYASQCRFLPPKLTWCYGPESFMSVIKTIACSTDKGTAAWKMAEKILLKFCLSYELLLQGLLVLDDL